MRFPWDRRRRRIAIGAAVLLLVLMGIRGFLVFSKLVDYGTIRSIANTDLRDLRFRIDDYWMTEGHPVPTIPMAEWSGATRSRPGPSLTTVREAAPGGLTSPIAYLRYVRQDRFSPDGGAYLYGVRADRYIIYSAGMDRDYDLQPPDTWLDGPPNVVRGRVSASTYDPTNGMSSSGDLVQLRFVSDLVRSPGAGAP